MIRISLLLLLVVLLSAPMMGQTNWQKAIDRFVGDPQLEAASVGVCLMDRATGEVLASHNAEQSLIPASTLKVVTTATALTLLGEDFRFKTYLEYDGEIDSEGTLRGNLYLRGSGDPTLGSPHFKKVKPLKEIKAQLVAVIQEAGIQEVEGQIVGDASYFEGAPLSSTWPWEDLGNYYASGAWGLNWRENYYFLHLQQQSQLGARPEVLHTDPVIPNLLLVNELNSAASNTGDNAYIFGAPYAYTRFIRGTIPVGKGVFKIKGSIPDPPFQAAHELLLALDAAKIVCSGTATSQWERQRTGQLSAKKGERKLLVELSSPSLGEIAREANHKSVNIYCEALLKVLGKRKGEGGTIEAGLAVVRDFWKAKGISEVGLFLKDGSGLSPRNGISSQQLTTFLREMAGEKEAFNAFFDSLPIGGKSGTLRYLFKGSVAEGRIRGKSGGMERVRAYTGYVKTVGGRNLVFTVIANNYSRSSGQIRKKMERLMIEFCKG